MHFLWSASASLSFRLDTHTVMSIQKQVSAPDATNPSIARVDFALSQATHFVTAILSI